MTLTNTLREIETNRVVKHWEEEDCTIYRWLLDHFAEADSASGIVPGFPWGEAGFVYPSPLADERLL